MPVLLLGLAVGVDAWALQTYGLRVDPDLARFHQVVCVAHLPAVGVAVRGVSRAGRGLVRALLPSLLVVVSCTAVAAAAGAAGEAAPMLSAARLVDALLATTWVWLSAALVLLGLLSRMPMSSRALSRARTTTTAELVVRLGAGAVLVALGLTMPATSRGLLERDRLGMLDQVRAVLTGYGDPQAVHLVTGYVAVLSGLLLLAALLRCRVRQSSKAANSTTRGSRAAGVPEGAA